MSAVTYKLTCKDGLRAVFFIVSLGSGRDSNESNPAKTPCSRDDRKDKEK